MLIVQFQELEFSARVVIARSTGSGIAVDLPSLKPGDWVPQDPMTTPCPEAEVRQLVASEDCVQPRLADLCLNFKGVRPR